MNTYKKGTLLEEYIEHVYRMLLELERNPDEAPIKLSKNEVLSKNGYSAEFDIYYEFKKAGILHKVGIECKNHENRISISELRNFNDKLQDFNLTGVFISNSELQSGAKSYAEKKGILVIRTKDLPHFFNLIGLRLQQIYLPTKHVKGEPFYILMESKEGELTGLYEMVEIENTKSIQLFLSKKHAEEYIKLNNYTDLVVRGLKQEAFDILINMMNIEKGTFKIICLPRFQSTTDYLAFDIQPDQLKSEYFSHD